MKRTITLAAGALAIILVGCTGAEAQPPAASTAPTSSPVAAAPVVTPDPTPEVTPEPETTSEPEPEETVEPLKPAGLTQLNTYAKFGDWDVRITKVNWNAAKALKAANMFNSPVPKGKTAVMVYVQAKYHGTERTQLDPGSVFNAVGPSGVEYTTFDGPTCGVLPEPNLKLTNPTVRNGGEVKGWAACWVVDNADVKGLTAFAEPLFSFGEDEIVEFALR